MVNIEGQHDTKRLKCARKAWELLRPPPKDSEEAIDEHSDCRGQSTEHDDRVIIDVARPRQPGEADPKEEKSTRYPAKSSNGRSRTESQHRLFIEDWDVIVCIPHSNYRESSLVWAPRQLAISLGQIPSPPKALQALICEITVHRASGLAAVG